jgi:hypothetical protein
MNDMRVFERKNLVFAWLSLISVGVVVLLVQPAESVQKPNEFDEINVRRINIVEPDGKPRVIISSRALMPGLYWAGKEYKHPTRDDGGFLFFNDNGDEVGGMTFANRKSGDNNSVHSGLLFDQYQQDQTLGLVYNERNGQRVAGMRVWNRPDESLFPAIELGDKLARATSAEEKAAIRQQMNEFGKTWQGKVGERFFAGKEADTTLVRLADANGKPRLVLRVDDKGQPAVEFLDESGKVTKRITDK